MFDVELTDAAIKAGLQGRARSTRGTLISASKIGPYIVVRRDGIRQADRYHKSFWKPLSQPPRGAGR